MVLPYAFCSPSNPSHVQLPWLLQTESMQPVAKAQKLIAAMEFGADVCFVDVHRDTEDIFQLEVDDGLANCAKEQAEAWRDAADEEGRSNEERHVIETVISRSSTKSQHLSLMRQLHFTTIQLRSLHALHAVSPTTRPRLTPLFALMSSLPSGAR